MGGAAAARAVAAVTRMTSDVSDADAAPPPAPASPGAQPDQPSAPAAGQQLVQGQGVQVHACESEDTDVMLLLGLEMLNPGGQELAASADLAEQQRCQPDGATGQQAADPRQ